MARNCSTNHGACKAKPKQTHNYFRRLIENYSKSSQQIPHSRSYGVYTLYFLRQSADPSPIYRVVACSRLRERREGEGEGNENEGDWGRERETARLFPPVPLVFVPPPSPSRLSRSLEQANRVAVLFPQKFYGDSRQPEHQLLLRVVTARVRYLLSVSLTPSPPPPPSKKKRKKRSHKPSLVPVFP